MATLHVRGRFLGLTRPSLALRRKPLESDPTQPPSDWNDWHCDAVVAKYRDICKAMPTRSILDLIRKPTVDMWQWEDYEVLVYRSSEGNTKETRNVGQCPT